jgi:hypothetical protein
MSRIPATSLGIDSRASAGTRRSWRVVRPGAVVRAESPAATAPADVAALVRQLSDHLLQTSTATRALHAWCAARSLSTGPITVVKQTPAQPPYPDDEALDELRPEQQERIGYRRVRLVRGALVLSEADNWFMPDRLPPEVREVLETTDVPFGTAIAQLQPWRRTSFVRFADLSGAPATVAEDRPAMTILEHRAVVLDRNHRPLSVVCERYRAALLGGSETPPAQAVQ